MEGARHHRVSRRFTSAAPPKGIFLFLWNLFFFLSLDLYCDHYQWEVWQLESMAISIVTAAEWGCDVFGPPNQFQFHHTTLCKTGPKKIKMCCRLRFKNVCENINLPGFPAGIICSVRLLRCSAAGPWPQRGELLSGPAVYCTSPLCSSSSFISSCRPYLPLPALFFTPASLSWKKGKKERRKKKSFLVRKQTLLWLPASPSSPAGRHSG